MSEKRSRDDVEDEEEDFDVYHYIAVSGGQEWGRQPQERSTAQPFTSRGGGNPNRELLEYWRSLVYKRQQMGEPTRIDLGGVTRTPLEAAVETANYKSVLPGKRREHITDPVAEAIRHFESVARYNVIRAEEDIQDIAARRVRAAHEQRRSDRASATQPIAMPGRPPRGPPPRGGSGGSLPIRQAGGIAGSVVPRELTPDDLIRSLTLDGARDAHTRFGRALKNRNMSAHKRSKYTQIYNALARML